MEFPNALGAGSSLKGFTNEEGSGLIQGIEFWNTSGAGRSFSRGFSDNYMAFFFLTNEDSGLIWGIKFPNVLGLGRSLNKGLGIKFLKALRAGRSLYRGFSNNCTAFHFLTFRFQSGFVNKGSSLI